MQEVSTFSRAEERPANHKPFSIDANMLKGASITETYTKDKAYD